MLCRMFQAASLIHSTESSSILRVISWNIGSLQTNPFEFWQAPGSSMRSFQDKLDGSLRRSTIKVEEVVSQDMMNEILGTILDESQSKIMLDIYKTLKLDTLHELITNPLIGLKRYVSLSDRVLRDHARYGRRPSLITGYSGDISSIEVWWPQYVHFMRNVNPWELLRDHDISKFGLSGLSTFELEHFKVFQLVHLILTDAAFIRIAENIPGWNSAVNEFNIVSEAKFDRISQIIESTNADVICLQEVDITALHRFDAYDLFKPPESNGKQDSLILLRKDKFKSSHSISVVRSVASAGDLVLLKSVHIPTGREIVVGSYHGDANGRTTIPFLSSLGSMRNIPDTVIIGSDTNAHANEELENKLSFEQLTNFTMHAEWKLSNPNGEVTTKSCRTFMQAQSHKGHHVSDIHYQSDPKDQILVRGDVRIVGSGIDFTGDGDDTVIPIPSARFPSDHALVWATLDLGTSHDDEL